MGRRIIDIDAPARFVAGEDERESEEACYVAAVHGRRRVAVILEREQLARLSDRLLAIVDELERRGLVAIEVGPGEVAPAEPPGRYVFRAAVLSMAWDEDGHRIIVEARSPDWDAGAGESAPPPDSDPEADVEEVPDDAPLGPDVLRVRLKPFMAQRFARQAMQVAASRTGRCPSCAQPVGQGLHRCPGPGTAPSVERPGG
jgi:uncharacterized repeat protein (TIGR03847 family)